VRGALQLSAAVVGLSLLQQFGAAASYQSPLDGLVLVCLASHVFLFCVSAAYHSAPWLPVAKARMQRLDHSMIYVKIAGSIGPFAWLAFEPDDACLVTGLAWLVAVVGIVQKVFLPHVPLKLSSFVQVAQAMLFVPILENLSDRFGEADLSALMLASTCYGIGAALFLLQRPRLWPGVFGYHELFHVFVVLGSVALGSGLLELAG
jgi:hemolysin III